jgi:hypothetical protein
MLVIYRQGAHELLKAPQDLKAAWRLAHKLQWFSKVPHYVGRV